MITVLKFSVNILYVKLVAVTGSEGSVVADVDPTISLKYSNFLRVCNNFPTPYATPRLGWNIVLYDNIFYPDTIQSTSNIFL